MKYCYTCGHELSMKKLEHEGMIPYCESCQEYKFPIFSTAISMVVLNPKEDKILLIQQYHRPTNILVAGYVNKGENAEEALKREMKEEIGREVLRHKYLKSEYFPKTNTLILNYAVVIDSESLYDISDWEVDHAKWFTFEEARREVKPDSLAQRFLFNFLSVYTSKKTEFFVYE